MELLEFVDYETAARAFQCDWGSCNKAFNRKSDLRRHYKIHTNERPYSCTVAGCGKRFIQRSALTVHIRTHTGEKPLKCQHTGCESRFSDSSSLARHRRIHAGKRPYTCAFDGCPRSFSRKSILVKHQRRSHQGYMPSTETLNGGLPRSGVGQTPPTPTLTPLSWSGISSHATHRTPTSHRAVSYDDPADHQMNQFNMQQLPHSRGKVDGLQESLVRPRQSLLQYFEPTSHQAYYATTELGKQPMPTIPTSLHPYYSASFGKVEEQPRVEIYDRDKGTSTPEACNLGMSPSAAPGEHGHYTHEATYAMHTAALSKIQSNVQFTNHISQESFTPGAPYQYTGLPPQVQSDRWCQ